MPHKSDHVKLFDVISKLSPEEQNRLASASHVSSNSEITRILGKDLSHLFIDKSSTPKFKPKENKNSKTFTFIDLFAGIGGFRMAMQNSGGNCIFSSEWDSQAKETYFHNYGKYPYGDITSEETKTRIPEKFDLLCAGFPCQAFSIAGKRGGFDDTRGTLFHDVAEIIDRRKPEAIFLENVKGLENHKSGTTLETILNVLRNDLKYELPGYEELKGRNYGRLNARDYGLPQNRERIFIVGFHKKYRDQVPQFRFPKHSRKKATISNSNLIEKEPVNQKYYLSQGYLDTLKNHKKRHQSKGNGFGYQVIPYDGVANAVVVGGMGRERNLVFDDRVKNFAPEPHLKGGGRNSESIRMMTPDEMKQLQGFPKKFKFPVADTHAYKQIGNSVPVNAIEATAREILKIIKP